MVKIGNVVLGEFPLLLAPMEDVSDPPFRALCKAQGADMMYTEFISSDGLVYEAKSSLQKLDIYDYERPIGIQYFGAQVESMMKAAEMVEAANPDVIDINYGCPVAKVACKMAGAGLLQDVPKMIELTKAVINSTQKPVTVKTRLGWDEKSINIVEVAERLQDIGVQAITIHGRTRKQMYKGEADWTWIAKVKENPRMHIPIFGNGDVDSPQRAQEYRNRYGVDGIMIGRASIGYPWVFREIKHYFAIGELLLPPTVQERVDAARQHLQHSIEWKGEKLGIVEMRRHYTNYFRGFPNIKPYRSQLVTLHDSAEIFAILDKIEEVYNNEENLVTA
ncbi:MAG: tRNA dihydrouridine synthase DusB [Saprospiraceae bacterium]|nr:tRNA dihydrouridine synthase DusB [Saprospiraceae bacterium]